jgi:hypothetical protein
MELKSIHDLGRVIRQRYAWPGGYPLYFVMSDGESMSVKSAWENRRELFQAWRDFADNKHERSGWRPVAVEINYEDDLCCCHSGEPIETAYGD